MFTSEKIAYRTAYQYITGEMDDFQHLANKIYAAMREVWTAREVYPEDKEELLNRWNDMRVMLAFIKRGWVRKVKAHIEAVAETWNLTF